MVISTTKSTPTQKRQQGFLNKPNSLRNFLSRFSKWHFIAHNSRLFLFWQWFYQMYFFSWKATFIYSLKLRKFLGHDYMLPFILWEPIFNVTDQRIVLSQTCSGNEEKRQNDFILRLGKVEDSHNFYSSISLLSIVSKFFKKAVLHRRRAVTLECLKDSYSDKFYSCSTRWIYGSLKYYHRNL